MGVQKITLSIDAMGGDNAPESVIQATASYYAKSCKKGESLSFIFVGNEEKIVSLLAKSSLPKHAYSIVCTKTVVASCEQPVKALRSGRESSMRKAIDMVKQKAAHACISSGNTGALMVMAKFVLGDLHSIKRPAITSVFPNRFGGGAVLLDVGANPECDAEILTQFALMGICFAKAVLNINSPKVGLLNIGHEEGKGREVDKEAYKRMKELGINFIGNIEPMDIAEGKVDVVVTDGFTGNITIKVAEAASSICMDAIKSAIKTNMFTRILGLFLRKHLKKSFALIDHRKYNGAMFVGVNGIVVKSHGSSDSVAFENAIGVAHNLAKRDVNKQLTKILNKCHNAESEEKGILQKLKKSSAKFLGIK